MPIEHTLAPTACSAVEGDEVVEYLDPAEVLE